MESSVSSVPLSAKPSLDPSVRLRLSVMMFLEFAIWGSWATCLNLYCAKLGFTGSQIGSLYGTVALGAMVSMFVAGQLADRVLSSEYLMAIFHLAGAALLFAMARIHDYNALWWTTLGYSILYNPTLSLSNSISFSNIPDATRDFPTLRVLGTFGWIAAGLAVGYVLPEGSNETNRPLLLAAALSLVLGLFSFALPHTPPTGKKSEAVPFLRALKLLLDPNFGIFFLMSFAITIALAFYYNFTSNFLRSLGVKKPEVVQTFGQVTELVFMLLLPWALKRLGMKGVLLIGMGAWAVRYGLFSLGSPFALVLIGVLLHGVCFDFFLAAGFIHTDNKAPPDIRASAQALFVFLTYGFGMWLGNILSGKVVDHFTVAHVTNWSKVWAVPAIGAAICLVIFLLLWRDRPGKLEEAESSDASGRPKLASSQTIGVAGLVLLCLMSFSRAAEQKAPLEISGRYPDLAMLNHQGECGTGAVVPWADRLWVITYAPHKPEGSDDKLYEIDSEMMRVIRPESVGGTPADRMIHRESNQLVIGPYFIDAERHVRAVPPAAMPIRLTAAARHLTDPADKIYLYGMEGELYEVDVHTLKAKKLFARAAPGAHGKGAYTAQGRLVVANNGNDIVNRANPAAQDSHYATDPEASGALAEWDGKTWTMLERREFAEITGPGGIEGSPDEKSPLWALGWDKRSVILKLLDGGVWHTYRLPVADYSYVAKHGWYTEWPRIREVGSGKMLMNMHGQWFDFPKTFSATNTAGIRPIGCYLKITGDFCDWNHRLVFGCDDASIMQNPLLGQSQSNLWFTTWDGLSQCGQPMGWGGPWVHDEVKAGEASEPYLFAGYEKRVVHLAQDSDKPVTFSFEIDREGKGDWQAAEQPITVPAHGYAFHVFPAELKGEWIRVKTDADCPAAMAYFGYGTGGGTATDPAMFASLPEIGNSAGWSGGTLRPMGEDTGGLYFASQAVSANGKVSPVQQYVFGPDMQFHPYSGAEMKEPADKGAAADYHVSRDEASLVLTQKKARFRLPISDDHKISLPSGVPMRHIREVVTERFLVNAGGSFFVLPRESAGGAMRLKPVCSHNKLLTDFCSWRGLMVIAGNRAEAMPDGHRFTTPDGSAALWFGDIDDLWKLGKPVGHGGPWKETRVSAGQPSDPYLMAGYDQRTIELSTDSPHSTHMSIQVDVLADGTWLPFREIEVPAGQSVKYEFPSGYSAHWVRVVCDSDCKATAQLDYR